MSASEMKFTRDMSLFNQNDFKEAKKKDKGWLSYIYSVPQPNGTIKEASKVLFLQAGTVI